MEFRDNEAIYLQIAAFVGKNILLHKWPAEQKIPSVRDLAIELQVNLNTVMRSYEFLEKLGADGSFSTALNYRFASFWMRTISGMICVFSISFTSSRVLPCLNSSRMKLHQRHTGAVLSRCCQALDSV